MRRVAVSAGCRCWWMAAALLAGWVGEAVSEPVATLPTTSTFAMPPLGTADVPAAADD